MNQSKASVWVALISAVGLIVVAMIQFGAFKNKAIEPHQPKLKWVVAGIIVNAKTNAGIGGANVVVVGRNENTSSQGDGSFSININDPEIKSVRLRINKQGFRVYDKTFDIPNESIIVQMDPE